MTRTAVAAGSSRSPTASALAQWVLVASIAWGVFAFGAVYPWAFWPLVVGILVVVLDGLLTTARPRAALEPRALSIALAALVLLIVVQLVPLPLSIVRALSPATVESIVQLDPTAAAGLVALHPLSIDPSLTVVGLVLFGSFALLLISAVRLFSIWGTRSISQAIAIVGVLVALVGIIQQPLYAGKIYGFWQPLMSGSPYGPFVNKNHFAGWMLMALPLTLGLACGGIARGMHGVEGTFRAQLLWFSSPDASRLVLLCGAAVIMALALVLTMSRSGMCALALALALTGIQVLHHVQRGIPRAVGVSFLVLVSTMAVWWVGAGTIANRFDKANWREFNDRKGAWFDAIGIAKRFPLTGSGLNTYGSVTLLYQQHDLAQHYAEAHNDYLQFAAEGGVLLVVPAIACVVLFAAAARRRLREETSVTTYWIRTGALTGIAAIALQEIVEFSLQMPGNALLFVVLCAIALHRTPERKGRSAIRMLVPSCEHAPSETAVVSTTG
jgi:hypothetical protein